MLKIVFEKELGYIQNIKFKEWVLNLLDGLPSYILKQPSSTTGKYHPTDEISSDGMIRHIKRCVLIAREISIMHKLPPQDQDVLIAGCILHDALKMGPNDIPDGLKVYTNPKHPIYIFEYINSNIPTDTPDNPELHKLYKMQVRLAFACLLHEGQWTIDEAAKLGEKIGEYTRFLCDVMHSVDFIASRRSIYDIMQKEYFEKV